MSSTNNRLTSPHLKWVGGDVLGLKNIGESEYILYADKEAILELYAELSEFIAYYKGQFSDEEYRDLNSAE